MRGGSLGDRLRAGVRQTRNLGGVAPNAPPPLSPLQRADIAAGTARGLAELHTQGIIHRDVKSTNILLDDECRPLVADMGLCRVLAPAATHTTTRRMGTDGYIDPEYSETLELREQSDVYSFGVVLLELISNQAAYTDGMNPPVRLRARGRVVVGRVGVGAGGRGRAGSARGAPARRCRFGKAGRRLCGDALRVPRAAR
jgi:serine/threonine protein kinase